MGFRAALLIGIFAIGCATPPAGSEPAESAGRIAGRVVGPDGRPVAGATVECWAEVAAGEFRRSVVEAGPDGRFAVPAAAGFATLTASAPGFAASDREALDPRVRRPSEIVLRLRRFRPIEGRVRLEAGGAVGGVLVRAFLRNGRMLEVRTGARGEFRFDEAPEDGVGSLQATDGSGTSPRVLPPKAGEACELRLPGKPVFGGRVLDTAGRPLAGLPVVLETADGKPVDRRSTDEDGDFRFVEPARKALRLVSPDGLFDPVAYDGEAGETQLLVLRAREFVCFHPGKAPEHPLGNQLRVQWWVEGAGDGAPRPIFTEHFRVPRDALPLRLVARFGDEDVSEPVLLADDGTSGCRDVSVPIRLPEGVLIVTLSACDATSGRPLRDLVMSWRKARSRDLWALVSTTGGLLIDDLRDWRTELAWVSVSAEGYSSVTCGPESIREIPPESGPRILDLGVVPLVPEAK